DQAAEVAGDRAERGADQQREADEEEGERDGEPRTPEDAREHVTAELVGAEPVPVPRVQRRRRILGERVVRRDRRCEDRDRDPGRREQDADDRERLAPGRRDTPATPEAREGGGSHAHARSGAGKAGTSALLTPPSSLRLMPRGSSGRSRRRARRR